jgi:hypothetical protein
MNRMSSAIFISHASADKDMVDTFVDDVLRLGCGITSESIFYSSGADTGVPSGADLNSYVRERVSEVGLVVAVITPAFRASPFCLAELGAAWSRVENLFPLLSPDIARDELDGVLGGLMVKTLDNSNALDELRDRIHKAIGVTATTTTWGTYKSKWLNSARALLPMESAQPGPAPPPKQSLLSKLISGSGSRNGSAHWGQLFDSFVDAALYTDDDSVGREEILRAAEVGTCVPGRYLYSSDSGADNWIRLCQDPMYKHHKESAEFWAGGQGRDLTKKVMDILGRNDFDYVSLGSGDGQKDASLVAWWLDSGADLFYYPYDISLPLVSKAIRTVRRKMPRASTGQLRIKAVLADFNHLSTVNEVFNHRDSPNVIALLGNSLGNLEHDLGFLRDLRQEMSDEDLLVLEVRLSDDQARLAELSTPQALRFDFGPLEHYLGLTFDIAKMTIGTKQGVSSIPDTTTTIIGCKEVVFREREPLEIKLMYIHEYISEIFLSTLKENDFEIVEEQLAGDDEKFLVCVLRKQSS